MSHPRIVGGLEKEVRFLVDEDEELATPHNVRACGLEGWRDCYRDKGQGNFDVWVDASPQYQYQKIALATIATLNPTPRILFITRKPSARLFSLYQYARYHQRCLPHVGSFEQFINELRPPVSSALLKQKMMVTAWEDTHYDKMLERWLTVVSPEKLFVVSLEDLNTSREDIIMGLADWLGVDPQPLLMASTDRSNPSVITRSKIILKTGAKIAKLLPENRAVRIIKNLVRGMNSKIIDKSEFESLRPYLASLDAEFAPSLARFEELLRENDIAPRFP